MKRKFVTPTARRHMDGIIRFINSGNPAAASRYLHTALIAFMALPDNVLPRRASERLPEHVRETSVPGFRGYCFRIAVFDDAVYMVAAFRPGRPDEIRDAMTRRGLGDIP